MDFFRKMFGSFIVKILLWNKCVLLLFIDPKYFDLSNGCLLVYKNTQLLDDFLSADGVKKAFDEFFSDKPESILELSGSQCLVTKI